LVEQAPPFPSLPSPSLRFLSPFLCLISPFPLLPIHVPQGRIIGVYTSEGQGQEGEGKVK